MMREAATSAEPVVPPGAKRPFPWLCPRCLQKQVHLAVIPYRAEMRHDGKLLAVQIPALHIPMCANCGELQFTDKVDQQIRNAFADMPPDSCGSSKPSVDDRKAVPTDERAAFTD